MPNPSETTNATTVRRRLRGSGAAPVAVAEPTPEPVDLPEQTRVHGSSAMIPRPKLSGLTARPRIDNRGVDVTTRTPLPREASRTVDTNDDVTWLQTENAELRALIEQAISQEEENERHAKNWQYRVAGLEEQVTMLKTGAGDVGELIVKLQVAEQDARVLTEQVRQLELQLQHAHESSGGADNQYATSLQHRDDAILELNQRIAELEQQIADIPPPAPTDEELARMADELERERCKINQIIKEFDEQKAQHSQDEQEMEKQMREMEVQMSKERAEIARQRTDLQRMQADIRADADSIMRTDNNNIRDRLQQSQRIPISNAKAPADGTPPDRGQRESSFMTRLFGKK